MVGGDGLGADRAGTMSDLLITSSIGRPDFMIREGLVVTPSAAQAARSLMSHARIAKTSYRSPWPLLRTRCTHNFSDSPPDPSQVSFGALNLGKPDPRSH